MVHRRKVAALLYFSFLTATIAGATTTCVFKTTASTMTLTKDCTTDSTIQVPAGFTLNGAKHLITAVDPIGGNFVGPVITNQVANSTINVENLIIDMPNLASGSCASIQGIALIEASGIVTGNTVLHVSQSGNCLNAGTGILVAEPIDAPPQTVTISNNRVLLASGEALFISGPFNATVKGNEFSINNLGTDAVEFGAFSGSFTNNTIETDPSGQLSQEAFVILNNKSQVKVASNTINLVAGSADFGIDLFGAGQSVVVSGNRVFNRAAGAGFVGIFNVSAANVIKNNEIRCYQVAIIGPDGKGNVTLPCPF